MVNRRAIGGSLVIVAIAIALLGCPNDIPVNLLEEADTLCREQKWDEAAETLRIHLADNPRDPGAHFLLGRAHLNLGHLVLAEGQFNAALAYFEAGGRANPIPRFPDADYFEVMCWIEMCKVYQRQLLILLELGAEKDALVDRVDMWAEALANARKVDPTRRELQTFEALLKDAREVLQTFPDEPERPGDRRVVPLT